MQLSSSLLACLFRAVGFQKAEFYLTYDPFQQCSSPSLFIHPSAPRDQSERRVKGFSVSRWCTISHLILSRLFPLFSPYSTQVARALSNNWLFSFFIFVRRERIPEDSATGAAKSNGRVCFWTSANRERGCVRENKRQEKRNSLHDLIKQTQMVTAGWPWVQDTETDRMEMTAWRD